MLTGREPLLIAAAGVLGLVAGSFLNVCIWRLPRQLSVVAPRSFCPACGRRLALWELVPLLSYLILGGRCRTCRGRISPLYPVVEAVNAAVYVLALVTWGPTLKALAAAVFGSLLLVGGLVDARHGLIPDLVTLPGITLGLVLSALSPSVGVVSALLGLMIGGGFLLALAVATSGGLGGGDIKLAAMMGAFLGWTNLLVALLLGFVSGAVFGGILMLSKIKGRRDLMAFGPFLAAGALAAFYWGPAIVTWYLRLFRG